jgi:hypothetical protein
MVDKLPREIAPGVFWIGDCLAQRHKGKIYHGYNAAFLGLLVLVGVAGAGMMWRRRPPPLPDRPLRIGFLHDPPYMQWGPDGHPVGLSVEVISEAARKTTGHWSRRVAAPMTISKFSAVTAAG